VHGVPNENPRVFKEGDIVSIDGGLKYKGLYTDMAKSVGVGKVDEKAVRLMKATKECLMRGIEAANPGFSVVDIGAAVEECAKPYGYGIVRVLGGHGVGDDVHEEPFIPNYKDKNFDYILKEGMVVAIEPMLTEGTENVYVDESDDWTFKTADDSRSAHFEHTIAITEDGPVILTEK